jgi:hypothetical protein
VVPQGFVVLFPVVLVVIFGALSWWFFLGCFQDLALGNLMGEICGNPSWFFGLLSPSQIRELMGLIFGFSVFKG